MTMSKKPKSYQLSTNKSVIGNKEPYFVEKARKEIQICLDSTECCSEDVIIEDIRRHLNVALEALNGKN